MVTFEEDARLTAEYWLGKSVDERLAAAALLINQRIPKEYVARSRVRGIYRTVRVPWR
jgi:hypothetical protein